MSVAETQFVAEPGADGPHVTYCRLCEAQCGLIVDVKDGAIVKVRPDHAHVTSSGHLCVKGPGMASITYDPDRVLTPLKRVGGPGEFEPVSWDEALDGIAARLKPVVAQDGVNVAMYKGNPCSFATLRFIYAGAFHRALGGGQYFSALHIDTGAKNLAMELVFGSAVDWTFPDLGECDFLIMMGANPMVSHMSIIAEPRALHMLQAIHKRGRVVVVDPRRTETAERFEHLPVLPDSDVWLLAAMLNHIFAEGLENRAVLEARTTGWEQLREAVRPITPEVAAPRCGVSAAAIRDLAERFVKARTAACYGRCGTNRGRYSTLANILIESLNVVSGRFGAAGGWISGIFPIAAPGAKPTLPAYGSSRSRIGNLPIIAGTSPGGAIAAEITTPGEGQIRAMFVDAGNPVISYPGGDELAEALEQLDLLVALDFYVTETSRHAHYILPATTFFERDDLTDQWVRNATRPWVQYVPAVVPPRGESRQEFDIYNAILERMGLPKVFADQTSPDSDLSGLMQVADAQLRRGAYGDQFGEKPDGISIDRLRKEFPSGVRVADRPDVEGTWSRVWTDDGKAHLWHEVTEGEFARLLAEPEPASSPDILYLFGRRKLGSMNSWMHNVERLVRSDRPTLLMHPDDARDRQIADGQQVRVATKSATVEVEVEVSDEVIAGSVNYPHGWGHRGGWRLANSLPGVSINLLGSSQPEDWEQVSGNVLVDGIPVTVSAA